MPIKKKKYNARFPPARIKKIMQIDEDVGKVAAAVPVIISRALEMFVETLLTKAYTVTSNRCARTLTPSHIKNCISSEARFDFLKDLVVSVPDLQGDRDDQPQTPLTPGSSFGPFTRQPSTASSPTTACSSPASASPLNASSHFSFVADNCVTKSGPPSSLQRQISTVKQRGRPRKQVRDASSSSIGPAELLSKKIKPNKDSAVLKRGPKKRQKVKRYVDEDDNDAFPVQETSDTSEEEELIEEGNEAINGKDHTSSNGYHPPSTNGNSTSTVTSIPAFSGSHPISSPATCYQTGNGSCTMTSQPVPNGNHIPCGLGSASAAATLRPSYHRSISYTQPTAYMQRSEHVINSGGVSFSLSYPMPLSPALPPLASTVSKSFFTPGTTQANCASTLTTSQSPVKSSNPAPLWSTQSAIDEDYDA